MIEMSEKKEGLEMDEIDCEERRIQKMAELIKIDWEEQRSRNG